MNIESRKKLSTEEKKQYSLGPDDNAFEYFFEKIIEERCDQFENELEYEGHEIIFTDMIPVATNIFNFKIIVIIKDEN